jgi:AraC-like DNA-binding protein
VDATHGISVALLRPLSELLNQLEADGRGFLADLGVDAQMAPNTYVSAVLVDRLLAAIADQRGDPAFSLTLAKQASARPLGLFGHLIWLSGTVRDALERAVKFYVVVTRRNTLVLEEGGDLATIRQVPASPAIPRGRILTEFPFASLAMRARAATGGAFALHAVRFAHAGEATAAYADVFGVPVEFGAKHDEIEIARDRLSLPLLSSDPITSAAIEAKIAELTAAAPADVFIDRVRRAGNGSPAAIAKTLGISERTLRRQLAQHGTNLRELTDQAHRARADALLAAGKTVKEVAFELGFSEPSAFSRAYKRWTGKAPSSE